MSKPDIIPELLLLGFTVGEPAAEDDTNGRPDQEWKYTYEKHIHVWDQTVADVRFKGRNYWVTAHTAKITMLGFNDKVSMLAWVSKEVERARANAD